MVVIIGPSGSGKSTLLRCTNRLEEIQSGDIHITGSSIHGAETNVDRLRQQTGMVFQDFNLFPHMDVTQNVALAPKKVKGINKEIAHDQAEVLLKDVGLGEELESQPSELSGGQKQRVAIARALAMEPSVMLFDEVTSALDPELVGEVLTVIEDLAASGMTMVLVTHEMNFAKGVGDRIVFMHQGRVVETTATSKFFEEPSTERAERFLSKLL